MTIRNVLPALLLLLLLAPLPARAESTPRSEVYAKLPTITVEYWDAAGLFHVITLDLTAVFPTQTSLNKKVSDKIAHALSAMTWEDFSRGNPAATVKAVALDVLRKEPSSGKVVEVLVLRLVMR
jgi:hypothetical protein